MQISLYSLAQIRAIESGAQALVEPGALMRRAGLAASSFALGMPGVDKGPILALAGPGNNGGDALECAANMAAAGVEVDVVHLAGSAAAPEAQQALARARASQARFVEGIAPRRGYRLAVDGLFGIGLGRALAGRARELVEALNRLSADGLPVLALDVPSGLDADTGMVVGPDGIAVVATDTLTFLGNKPGLYTGDGVDYAGRVHVDLLGTEEPSQVAAQAVLSGPHLFKHCLRPRRRNSHKGSYGDVAVLGGAHGMLGAALLACRTALHAGAGRVFGALVEPGLAVDPLQPEIMLRDAAGMAFEGRTVVAGPGMGDSVAATRMFSKVLDAKGPLVVDADALNLTAASPDLQARLTARGGQRILTPHPLEAARLLGVTAAIVQADRLENARELAMRFDAVVILKGAGSVIARPDGMVAINTTGNPGLATGGTGDVLAGLCGALLAQGWPAWEAAVGAAWVHGAAADRLVAGGCGPVGLTAGELPVAIRAELNVGWARPA